MAKEDISLYYATVFTKKNVYSHEMIMSSRQLYFYPVVLCSRLFNAECTDNVN